MKPTAEQLEAMAHIKGSTSTAVPHIQLHLTDKRWGVLATLSRDYVEVVENPQVPHMYFVGLTKKGHDALKDHLTRLT